MLTASAAGLGPDEHRRAGACLAIQGAACARLRRCLLSDGRAGAQVRWVPPTRNAERAVKSSGRGCGFENRLHRLAFFLFEIQFCRKTFLCP
jgi:hypothetical protein